MKISEIITQLQAIYNQYGDIDTYLNDDWGKTCEDIKITIEGGIAYEDFVTDYYAVIDI